MDYGKIEEKYVAPTYGRRGLTFVKGKGVYLYDSADKKYIDCFSNVGVNILGHNVKEINDAVYEQSKKLMNLHCSFYNDKRALFAQRLIKFCPKNLKKVFFCNSGTESVEAAIKFARLATGKKEILSAKMGYHGKTFGSLSLTRTNPKYRKSFTPLLSKIKHFVFNDSESLKQEISENTAAVILEPVQGEGGIRPADKGFLREVRNICTENNVLLIIDEVQTGMGRTGKMFAIEHFDVDPDIMCLAKGLAGGVPIGATVISEKVSEKLFKGCHTNTFGGNPLVCAAGLAVLDYIEKNNILENAEKTGNYFIQRLKSIDSKWIREVRGMGLMIGVELKRRNVRYLKALQENGVIAFPSGSLVIRFLPPLIITKQQVDEVVGIFEKVIKK
ncbi:acetylornithine/succinylornithine family transaminase [Candidatus Woesearchaeota archaeon]|nr:acetylornithine/succinylornithine family transaminase [Candidatus Woesearchaeota archaeon]